MQHSDKPFQELDKANEFICGMRQATSLDEFEHNWKEYLHHLERVWNKASAHFSKSPKWNGWKGRFETSRKHDPLLSYLVNARGAEEHTVNEIVAREPGGIGIGAAEGGGLFVEEMIINQGNISIRSPHKIKIDFIPARTRLIPVTNRGRTYNVPDNHLGNPIDPNNVIEIAEAGLQFYANFLSEAEKHFVK